MAPKTRSDESDALLDREVRVAATADVLREALTRKQQILQAGRDGGPEARGLLASEETQRLALTAVINPHLPIAWPRWPPGVRPKITAALQKTTRRLLAWYINPIVAQQNTYNHNVLRAIEDVQLAQRDLARQLATLQEEMQALSASALAAEQPPYPLTPTQNREAL